MANSAKERIPCTSAGNEIDFNITVKDQFQVKVFVSLPASGNQGETKLAESEKQGLALLTQLHVGCSDLHAGQQEALQTAVTKRQLPCLQLTRQSKWLISCTKGSSTLS